MKTFCSFINTMVKERKRCPDVMKKHFNKELVITKKDVVRILLSKTRKIIVFYNLKIMIPILLCKNYANSVLK